MNETLYEEALEAINRLNGDTSVSPEETRVQLRALRDELEMLIDAISADIKWNNQ